jgi:hypothetical protein
MKLVVSLWTVCGVFVVSSGLVAQVAVAPTTTPKPKSATKSSAKSSAKNPPAVWTPDVQQTLGI